MPEERKGSASLALPGHLIRRLHQVSTMVFHSRVEAAGYDITPVQFSALDALAHNPEIDQKGLAKLVAKDRATLGSVLERLEQKGLVDRRVSPQDKRARVLALTPEGEAVLAKLLPVVMSLQRDILPGLDEEEYRQFIALAAKVSSVAAAGEG
ncbi:MarR family winged helix-turn-helix transcriptional regulator [Jiella mangrovi]|uniref:MarR family transcriptional regulator n=1 Tax=Jiella mangrovi TaxID=2821407 RepID=A0ABS4BMD1_9HYPH|nr:MarR family transcriptional regulator [Jiella mangrovi]MBP0617891.1 MarR family transcriptional regulator [Jiella mangrovi]